MKSVCLCLDFSLTVNFCGFPFHKYEKKARECYVFVGRLRR